MNKNYSDVISSETEKIASVLRNIPELKIAGGSPDEVTVEAELYALSAGGKRIRPVLAIEFYKLFGNSDKVPEYIYEAACALEMTHTFSLIHDDMPEMDDDDLRRGKPATHVKYGNAVGLLSGDGLAILPYEILSRLSLEGKISPETAIRLIYILSKAAGNRGMIAGQTLDLWSEERSVDLDFLRKMSELKTGAMLKASCAFGAVLAKASDEKVKTAETYAEKVGLAFQIIDDILDVTSSDEVLGKPVGSDSGRNKKTFADILGIDGAQSEAEKLSEEAAELIMKYPGGELLSEFALSLCERKK